jgi:hypothetical protein
MKKLFGIALFFLATLSVAQKGATQQKMDEVVWYGLDFTQTAFVGSFDQGMGAYPTTGTLLRDKWVPQWNNLVVAEQPKFDLSAALHGPTIYYDINTISALNLKMMDVSKCMTPNPIKLDDKTVIAMVKNYQAGTKKSGIGMAFIVESFNKVTNTAGVYIVLFDIASNNIFKCKYFEGRPMGAGLRNYWAGAIKDIIKQMGYSNVNNW